MVLQSKSNFNLKIGDKYLAHEIYNTLSMDKNKIYKGLNFDNLRDLTKNITDIPMLEIIDIHENVYGFTSERNHSSVPRTIYFLKIV